MENDLFPRLKGISRTPWSSKATTSTDCTFHQIAPYIGRMKTSIAAYLVNRLTNVGDIVADPFCGCGVVPLEAIRVGRNVIAGDINDYGYILTKAKLFAPKTKEDAIKSLDETWELSLQLIKEQDLRKVPLWVRRFFHPGTLRSALAFRDACIISRNHFLLACLLGILHHQRPGFLSYPSSHLVPYLRDKLFPKDKYPELYEERDVRIRLERKIHRTYRRPLLSNNCMKLVHKRDARRFSTDHVINAVITSPPYMNELDYIRDNRLRLWFIDRSMPTFQDVRCPDHKDFFVKLIQSTLVRLRNSIAPKGYIALVVGDVSRGKRRIDSSTLVKELFVNDTNLNTFSLIDIIIDTIPDIRRSRRDYRGTKQETVLIYQLVG